MTAYLVSDSLAYCRSFVKNIPATPVQVIAADEVNAMIWRAYPWRWSLAALTPIALVDGTQDYAIGATDLFRPINFRLVRTDATPDEQSPPLHIVSKLEPNLQTCDPSLIEAISYEGFLAKFRLERAVTFTSTVTWQIQGEYQTIPTKITATSAGFPFPDQYINVFNSGYLWKLAKFADDARAGGQQTDGKGRTAYTGFYGEFMAELWDMMGQEGYGFGDSLAPSESLMAE